MLKMKRMRFPKEIILGNYSGAPKIAEIALNRIEVEGVCPGKLGSGRGRDDRPAGAG